MARPETHEDIPSYMRSAIPVADFGVTEVMEKGSVELIAATFRFLELAQKEGYEVSRAGELKATRPRSAEELDKTLKAEQKSWDRNAALYKEALADPAGFMVSNKYSDWQVNRHAETEGLTPISWPSKNDSPSQNGE